MFKIYLEKKTVAANSAEKIRYTIDQKAFSLEKIGVSKKSDDVLVDIKIGDNKISTNPIPTSMLTDFNGNTFLVDKIEIPGTTNIIIDVFNNSSSSVDFFIGLIGQENN